MGIRLLLDFLKSDSTTLVLTGHSRSRSHRPRLFPPVRLRQQDARNCRFMPPTGDRICAHCHKLGWRLAQVSSYTVPQARLSIIEEHWNRGKRLHWPNYYEKFPSAPKRPFCSHLKSLPKSPTSCHLRLNVKKKKCKEEYKFKDSL